MSVVSSMVVQGACPTEASILYVSVEYMEFFIQSLNLAAMFVRMQSTSGQGTLFYTPLRTLRCTINNAKYTLRTIMGPTV